MRTGQGSTTRATRQDEEFAAVAGRERPLLQSTAFLLTGDADRAERVVQLVLAQLYEEWAAVPHPHLWAVRALTAAAFRPLALDWDPQPRFELVDRTAAPPAVDAVVSDLQRLPEDQRTVIVLERVGLLPTVQIAEVLSRPVDEVLVLARQARAALVAARPERADDAQLGAELSSAVPPHLRSATDPAEDLAHGRSLVRRRSRRRALTGGVALVAAVLLVVAALALRPAPTPVERAQQPPAVTTSPAAGPTPASCDLRDTVCRATVIFAWRSAMAEVARPYLDPEGRYFSGFGYSYDARYETSSFWEGNGGALGFEMFRLEHGATEVYLQIATSYRFAPRCGATTRQRCSSFRFMDGNRFSLSDSTLLSRGMEVQYSPNGTEVITVVARNTMKGKELDIGRGDLIQLVEDPRLHLPAR